MALIAVNPITRTTGITPYGVPCASGGDSFLNTGRELIIIQNGTSVSITATIAYTGKLDGETPAPRVYTINGFYGSLMLGPYPPKLFNDANGYVNVTYTGVLTSVVTIAAFVFVAEPS